MIKTYTRTLFIPDLSKATVRVEMIGSDLAVEYKGVTSWDIISGGEEAKKIEEETDQDGIDPYHEYLVLHFEDGSTSTFRNSKVLMLIR